MGGGGDLQVDTVFYFFSQKTIGQKFIPLKKTCLAYINLCSMYNIFIIKIFFFDNLSNYDTVYFIGLRIDIKTIHGLHCFIIY